MFYTFAWSIFSSTSLIDSNCIYICFVKQRNTVLIVVLTAGWSKYVSDFLFTYEFRLVGQPIKNCMYQNSWLIRSKWTLSPCVEVETCSIINPIVSQFVFIWLRVVSAEKSQTSSSLRLPRNLVVWYKRNNSPLRLENNLFGHRHQGDQSTE